MFHVKQTDENGGQMQMPEHKAGLFLAHDEHKLFYQDAAEWIDEQGSIVWAAEGERERAIETDSVWDLQWYPDTPVGSYRVLGATLDAVLEVAKAWTEGMPSR